MSADEIRDLLAARALGGLDAAESAAADAAAARDPDLARELALFRATVADLERALPPGVPDPALLDRIVAATREPEPSSPPTTHETAAQPTVARVRGRGWLRPLAAALTVCVVAGGALLVGTRGDDASSPIGRAALAAAGVTGEALLFDDRLELRVAGLAPPPAGHHYQVWVLPAGSETMDHVAQLDPAGGRAELNAPLPRDVPYVAIDVSLDPDGATAGPGPTVVLARFE